MSLHIAVDVGGTQLRAACFSTDSLTPISLSKTPTQGVGTPLERLQDLIESLLPTDRPVASIGVAAPGPFDPYEGIIIEAPNIPGWYNFPLGKKLEEHFGIPVAVGNDANLAALGEWQFGAGQGHHHLIYLTVSTGIGGGVIIDDRLLVGARGLAAELGHVTIIPDGPLCGCGAHGHLEAVASGTAIGRWVSEELRRGAQSSLSPEKMITGRMISHAAQGGDDLAVKALNRAGTFIGQALANFLHIFNPSIVIVGGGVSQSGPYLLEPMAAAMRQNVMSPAYVEGVTLATAALGDEAGLMGALALARSRAG